MNVTTTRWIRRIGFLLLFAPLACAPAQTASPVVITQNAPNRPDQQAKPYVVLVSLDGFRYDYASKYGARNLNGLAARGASAPQGMIPVFPSLTFPNHYTLITGLYPEHHGIVANSFYDPLLRRRFAYTDPASSTAGSWYEGVPLWTLAERAGMRAACFFWPGSEGEIAGFRPSYYVPYDAAIPNGQRIAQVVSWLGLPANERPHFITLYISTVDTVGHEAGPDSTETAEAVSYVDRLVGQLVTALDAIPLPIYLIVVSDHGMETVQDTWISLDEYADLSDFETVGSLLYPQSEAAANRVYQQLRGASDKFDVYRRNQLPARFHYRENPRIGNPIVIATGPYLIRARDFGNPNERFPKGMHGYDPYRMASMRGIFYAVGPDIRPGSKVAPFESVHIYPFIARLLGLEAPPTDGEIEILEPIWDPPTVP